MLRSTNLKDNSVTHCLSSACAGLVGATMGAPADVVKARIMNQPTNEHGKGMRLYKLAQKWIRAYQLKQLLSTMFQKNCLQ